MAKFEVYEVPSGRKKKYIVTKDDADYVEVISYAKKFFKCSEAHISFEPAWLYKGKLYLEDPMKYGTKRVGVAYWI